MKDIGWKRIVISSNAELCKKNSCVSVKTDDTLKMIPIGQIDILIIESEQVSITTSLMTFLVSNGVRIVFCDCKHNPYYETVSYTENTYSPERLKKQIDWNENQKQIVWNRIVENKIRNQSCFLKIIDSKNYLLLNQAADDFSINNTVELEAEAAKLYFHSLFGKNFKRRTDNSINAALNYGYSILLSSINRLIVYFGYNTSLGINHHNGKNYFNLSCDLIEPFRPFVDKIVYENQNHDFNKEYKKKLINIGNEKIAYNGHITTLDIALELYIESVLKSLNTNSVFEEVVGFAE